MEPHNRILARIIDWEYPAVRKPTPASIYDFGDEHDLLQLVFSFGNGTILEMSAICESHDAHSALIGLAQSTGGFRRRALSTEEHATIWLDATGCDCYVRDGPPRAFLFIDPMPQPSRFGAGDPTNP